MSPLSTLPMEGFFSPSGFRCGSTVAVGCARNLKLACRWEERRREELRDRVKNKLGSDATLPAEGGTETERSNRCLISRLVNFCEATKTSSWCFSQLGGESVERKQGCPGCRRGTVDSPPEALCDPICLGPPSSSSPLCNVSLCWHLAGERKTLEEERRGGVKNPRLVRGGTRERNRAPETSDCTICRARPSVTAVRPGS
ncbi:hypothetical protein GJAV_G00193790 [Gymnothorax javanicus]|nr:hypothetical protein GJAV_G00193790 [Gymnothorax javanicus]